MCSFVSFMETLFAISIFAIKDKTQRTRLLQRLQRPQVIAADGATIPRPAAR